MIENEIRGKLSTQGFRRVTAVLSKKGTLLKNYKRLSVDLSPGYDPKSKNWPNGSGLDIRIKKSGLEEKISLKVGDFHLQKREEIDVKLREGQFLASIEMFRTIGYDKGLVYFWESWEYEYNGFEIKLSKYNDDYFVWEIEVKNDKDPRDLAKELKIYPWTKEDYRKQIDWENMNVHRIFDLETVKKLLKEFE